MGWRHDPARVKMRLSDASIRKGNDHSNCSHIETRGLHAGRSLQVACTAAECESISEKTGVARDELRWLAECCMQDRKSTRLNSSHMSISYAVFCLKKKRT